MQTWLYGSTRTLLQIVFQNVQAYVWPIVLQTLGQRGLHFCPDWKHTGVQSMFTDIGVLL